MKNLPGVLFVFGIVTSIWALSTSCMMHNMGMSMNDNMKMMDNSQPDTLSLTDPVCGIQIDTSTALTFNYEGNTYYFDSQECLKVFQRNPDKFLKGGTEKSKQRMNSSVMMGGVAMAAMMAVMTTGIFVGGWH